MKKILAILIFGAFALGFSFNVYADAKKTVSASKFFPYYEKFLSLPPSSRDGLIVNYYAKSDGKPPENVFIIHNGVRTKLNFAPDGKVLNLPTLEMVKYGQIEINGKPGKKNTIGFSGDPNIPLSSKIELKAVKNSIEDLTTCMKIVGPLSLVIPKVNSVAFKGVSAGKAIMPDGSHIPLPINKDGVVVDYGNKKLKGAVYIEFNTRPSGVVYSN